MRLTILQHDDNVHLGSLAAPLAARELEVETIGWDDDLGRLADATAVLILGGRTSVVAEHRDERIQEEIDAITDLLDRDIPMFGLCLGAQLIAEAGGGEVLRREVPELELVPLDRTVPGMDDPVTAGWPDGASAVLYHEDEVVLLPEGSQQLIIGSDGPSVWRVGNAYAAQPHLEATAALVHGWLDSERGEAFTTAAGIDVDDFRAELATKEPFYTSVGASLVLRWLDDLRRSHD